MSLMVYVSPPVPVSVCVSVCHYFYFFALQAEISVGADGTLTASAPSPLGLGHAHTLSFDLHGELLLRGKMPHAYIKAGLLAQKDEPRTGGARCQVDATFVANNAIPIQQCKPVFVSPSLPTGGPGFIVGRHTADPATAEWKGYRGGRTPMLWHSASGRLEDLLPLTLPLANHGPPFLLGGR